MALVLIGFAEAIAAPEVVFSLVDAGHQVRAFTRRGARPLVTRRLPVGAAIEITAPEEDAKAAVADLTAAAGELDNPVILALDDASLWLTGQATVPLGLAHASATGDSIALALDKTRQIEAARAAGLAVPETRIATDHADLTRQTDFPVIVKPALAITEAGGRLTKGAAHYLETESDLAALPRDAAQSGPVMIQPLIHGTGEGIFGFAGPDGITAWSGHRRLRMMNPHGSGSSACQSIPPDPALQEAAARMVTACGWRGPFMIELLRGADGTPWFMELNGRLWGSLALARRGGLEYPTWAVAQALDPAFRAPDITPPPGRVLRHLGRDLAHLAFVLRGPKSTFHRTGWPRFWPALTRVLRPGRRLDFYNTGPEDRWYFVHDAWTVLAGLARRRR